MTLVVTGHSEFCYSTDGGSTWTEQATDFGGGQLIFTGTEFYVPQTYAGRAWVSTDGRQFTEVSTTQHPGNAWRWSATVASLTSAEGVVFVDVVTDESVRLARTTWAWRSWPASR